ncbi:MAG: hypothetical protein IT449_05075 [Phycisphaerales bacterium]|nr:hypothetical protein [Phycisphaerales bacterium]
MHGLMPALTGKIGAAMGAVAAIMSLASSIPDAAAIGSAAAPQSTAVENRGGNAVQRATGGVTGGAHDLSKLTGRLRDTCSACHVPHVLGIRADSSSRRGDPISPSGATSHREATGSAHPLGEARASDADALRDDPARSGQVGPATHEAELQPPRPEDEGGEVHSAPESAGAGASLQMYRIEGQRSALSPGRFAPGPTSLVCLSCHDGTVASSAIGGAHALLSGVRDGFDVPDGFVWRDHPIGVEYPAQKKGYVPLSKLEAQGHIRLPGQRVECVSCHDPHNAAGEPYLLSVSNRRSALCLSCHVK